MLGLLVIIVISWALLRIFEKKNIEVLGVMPNLNRLTQFTIGVLIMTLIVLLNIYVETQVLSVEWRLNTVNYSSIVNAFGYHLRSALTEDLVFRGAILYILIQRLGAKWAILISALCFGVYHVFSYGIANERAVLIAYVVVVTGFAGYVWAYSFYKTKSIMLPLGFHLGYNMVMSFFFEAQPYGELVYSQVSKVDLTEWSRFYFSIFKGLFPSIATLICVKLLLNSKLYLKAENV